MAFPTYDNAFADELISDVDAYLNRLTVLIDFAVRRIEEHNT